MTRHIMKSNTCTSCLTDKHACICRCSDSSDDSISDTYSNDDRQETHFCLLCCNMTKNCICTTTSSTTIDDNLYNAHYRNGKPDGKRNGELIGRLHRKYSSICKPVPISNTTRNNSVNSKHPH